MDNGHDSDCARHNAPAYSPGPCDCLPTQAMCRAAVIYLNGADVYDKLPRDVLEIEENIYAEVWKSMQAAAPGSLLVNRAAEIEQLQRVWEDTRTQRDELLAHIAGKAPLPQWAADWLRA